MLPRYEVQPPPPLLRLRDVVRLVMLGIVMLLLVFVAHKASRPQTWRWVQGLGVPPDEQAKIASPAAPSEAQALALQLQGGQAAAYFASFTAPLPTPLNADAALAFPLHLEHVPLPEHIVTRRAESRRAPLPDFAVLAGAVDRELFLLDHAITTEESPENRTNERKRRDADARYHLLELAHGANAADLVADARSGVRYSSLVEKPMEFRGELIRVAGDLLWIKHFELTRQVPGLPHAYLGVVAFGRPDQAYWILFTDLPPGMPPEKEWSELYLRDVRFAGYFHKVLKVDHPREKGVKLYVPVLVGKSVELSGKGEERWEFPLLATVSGIAAFLLLALLVVLWLRRGDRSHAERLAAIRARSNQAPPANAGGSLLPEFRFEDNPAHPPPDRNGHPS
jgi:hypothetical protein